MLIQINKEVECWFPIDGYNGFYEISNLGNVKSLGRKVPTKDGKIKHLKEKILKPQKDEAGYLHVVLCRKNIKDIRNVHRLICESYLKDENKKGLIVNHKNGIKYDNRLDNLEFVTYSQNIKHGFDVLGRKIEMKTLMKKVSNYDLDGNKIGTYKSIMEASRMTGTHERNISFCINNHRKTANKFIWKLER